VASVLNKVARDYKRREQGIKMAVGGTQLMTSWVKGLIGSQMDFCFCHCILQISESLIQASRIVHITKLKPT